MGASQSVRATAFQRPKATSTTSFPEEEPDDHHISISNKMVERLVEDATLAGGAAAATAQPTSRGDYRDKIFIEKLKCMDDTHSELTGITVEDLNALAARIDIRTSNMASMEPVCADCKERVIECYDASRRGAFTKCVQETAMSRLRARTMREARDRARRTRHVARAREHALRDLATT
ncbi:hypothetical protein HF086_012582 [Spodoptera exigua]|uniref:Uncharacterized protein n=1 Tax=Spodoptera exigua TaxID=7107 RepID=A0A922M5B5_SPOEX|nr:hypothetical protein HF086_012582 [Spodoptera exigua]